LLRFFAIVRSGKSSDHLLPYSLLLIIFVRQNGKQCSSFVVGLRLVVGFSFHPQGTTSNELFFGIPFLLIISLTPIFSIFTPCLPFFPPVLFIALADLRPRTSPRFSPPPHVPSHQFFLVSLSCIFTVLDVPFLARSGIIVPYFGNPREEFFFYLPSAYPLLLHPELSQA